MPTNSEILLQGARDFIKAAADVGMVQQLANGAKSLVNKVDLKNPLHAGVVGAGVGAAGGLAGSMLTESGRKNKLRNTLMGGGAGAGLGAAASALKQSGRVPGGP